MLHYLLEDGVTTEEWKLRQKVLDLHNTIVRLRLFKGLGNSAGETYKTFKKSAELLRAELATLPAFKSLEEQRRSKIMSGNELYIRGMRSVLKQLKIDVEYFDAIYNYLSAQVHVSPNTYYDMHKRINFGQPAPYQLFVASFAVANARIFLLPAAFRVASTNKKVVDQIDAAEFTSMQNLSKRPFADSA